MFKHKVMGSWALGVSLALAAAMPAAAETQQGWYFGVSPGQSKYDISKGDLDVVVADAFAEQGALIMDGDSSFEDSDMTWSVFGGYRLSEYFAVEAGYLDLGTAEYRSSGNVILPGFPGTLPASMDMDFQSRGFTATAIGGAPLGDMVDLHARLGVLFADSEVSLSAAIDDARVGQSLSGNSQDLFYGVGAALHFGANWSMSLDWQQYKDVGKEDETSETDISSITLGFIYRL